MKTLATFFSVCFMFFAVPQAANAAYDYSADSQKASSNSWDSQQDKTSDSASQTHDQQGMLYVITGPSGTLDGDLLTINSVPQVIFFSKGPNKKAGQVSIEEFINNWPTMVDPQGSKATLVINSNQGPQQVVVMLTDPKVVNGNLTYKAEIIEGNAQGSFTESSLFIDGTSCPFCH